MTTHDHPPQWMTDYFQDTRQLFGIGDDWKLWLKVADDPNNEPDNDGCCHLDPRYLKATIIVRRALSEERAREVIMHELLHVVLAPVTRSAERICDMVPAKRQDHARDLYTDAEEQTIERLTRALQRTINPKGGESDRRKAEQGDQEGRTTEGE